MQQNSSRSEAFKSSSLFNTAKLTVDSGSSSSLREALRYTEQEMVKHELTNNSDKQEPKTQYATNSYVIKGEWVAYGFSNVAKTTLGIAGTAGGAWAGASVGAKVGSIFGPIGTLIGAGIGAVAGAVAGNKVADKVSFDGLGRYPNSIIFDFKQDAGWGKHDLKSFFESDSKLKYYFSHGYRMDKQYDSLDTDGDGWTDVMEKHLGTDPNQANDLNGIDTDGDGWSDKLEIQMGTDFYTANSKPNIDSYYDIKADEKAFLAIAGTETKSGALVDVQAVEMQAQVQDGKLVYTPTDSKLDLNITSSEWQNWLASGSKVVNGTSNADVLRDSDASEVIWGGAGNDTIIAGNGGDVLIGGSGNDTFVFNHLTDKPSIIADFSVGDKLNLNGLRGLFEQDYGANFKWLDVFRETPTSNQSALVWSNETDTLSYQASNSTQLTAIVRFDDDIATETLRNAMIT